MAEISRLWEDLRPLAEEDASLWQVLAAWLRTGLADYIQGMKLEGGDGGMYATIEEAYAARRAEDAQRISIESRTDYVRERHGEDAATAVAAFLADWQDFPIAHVWRTGRTGGTPTRWAGPTDLVDGTTTVGTPERPTQRQCAQPTTGMNLVGLPPAVSHSTNLDRRYGALLPQPSD